MSSTAPRIAAVLTAASAAAALLATPAAQAEPHPAVTWEDCPEQVTAERAQCGRVEVPTYYDNPAAGTISVGFVKVPAANQSARRGALFTNPGGPSGDAYSYAGGSLMDWPEGITDEWDVIGVQPRGLEGSTPVHCVPSNNQVDAVIRVGAYVRDSCEATTPGYTNSLTTENTARDWEVVRQALSEDKISILGLSYGTFLGSTYATLFPQHTDRVVLDSAMSPKLAWNGILGSQQAGYENALHDFFGFMAANDATYHQGTTPLAVYQRWSNKVAAEAGVHPTVLPPSAQIGDLPPGLEFAGQPGANIMTATGPLRAQGTFLVDKATHPDAVQATSPTLGLTRGLVPIATEWDGLAKHIAGIEEYGAQEQPASRQEQAPSPEEQRKAAEAFANAQNMQNLILCNENQYSANYALLPAYVWSNYVTADPFTAFNALYASGAACSGRGPVTTPIAISGAGLATRPLQIAGTGDPQTPYAYFRDTADPMGSHVVTVHGPGHGHVAYGNKAVDDIVVDYLRTGTTTVTDAPGLH